MTKRLVGRLSSSFGGRYEAPLAFAACQSSQFAGIGLRPEFQTRNISLGADPKARPASTMNYKLQRKDKLKEIVKKFEPFYSKHDFHPLEPIYCNDFNKKSEVRKNLWYHRKGHKRASTVLRHLNVELQEEFNKKNQGKLDSFKPGDAVEVKFRHTIEAKRDITFRGVVIGINNRGFSSSFRVLGGQEGTSVEYNFQKYSPLLSSVSILQKSFIHDGKKRTKRAKLYYLRDRPLAQITIPKTMQKPVTEENNEKVE